MPREAIPVADVASNPAYSNVIRSGSLLFLSGQVARNEAGEVVGVDDPEVQAKQAFENVRRILAAAGATFDDVVKMTLYVTDPSARQAVAEERMRLFREPRPATTYLQVAGLANPECMVEVDVVAEAP